MRSGRYAQYKINSEQGEWLKMFVASQAAIERLIVILITYVRDHLFLQKN